MVTLFYDMMHKEIEVYVDDMIAKSCTPRDHFIDLRKLFKCHIKYQLRQNPNKCVFGTSSGKLLGFIVSQRRIEVDPSKSPSHLGHADTAKRETDSQLLRKHQLHSSLHSIVNRHMWSVVQPLEERHKDRMDRIPLPWWGRQGTRARTRQCGTMALEWGQS